MKLYSVVLTLTANEEMNTGSVSIIGTFDDESKAIKCVSEQVGELIEKAKLSKMSFEHKENLLSRKAVVKVEPFKYDFQIMETELNKVN
ncbi:MAG: hypothetical protein MRZ40_00820 [Ligilactobacillus animalis]|uniref:hypothetical protein n=1 Tax=Ligilactobacillus animalis TaxID=1605 RepID=UPI0024327C68|nr:hypothetical protein [Ligilactobacillus animalis]MCI5941103.1 hypothetical protein [Ligilactobacillus animalis]MDY2993517.1 hypothetical protein [Ligilactobacillus animalis]